MLRGLRLAVSWGCEWCCGAVWAEDRLPVGCRGVALLHSHQEF